MAKEKTDLRKTLRQYKMDMGLIQQIDCSPKENKEIRKILKETGELPEGVYTYEYDYGSEFYRLEEADLTEAEIAEYLTYKQLSLLRTIKNCVVFFTVLTVLGLIGGFMLMSNLGV